MRIPGFLYDDDEHMPLARPVDVILFPLGIVLLMVAALTLVGCDGDKRPAQPQGGGVVQPSQSGRPSIGGWRILYSTGMPATFDNSFDFPTKPHEIDYVVRPATSGRSHIRLEFTIEGDGKIEPSEREPPPRLRLFLQRSGDDLTLARGPSYRFWSEASVVLVAGTHVLEVPLTFDRWTNVNGQKDAVGFGQLLDDIASEGFTFGGIFAGHGVWLVNGSARFIVRSYERR